MPVYITTVQQTRRRRRRLGQSSCGDWFPSWNPLTWIPASTVECKLGNAYTDVTAPIGSPGSIPGSGVWDVLVNAATGKVTQNQKAAIDQQNANSCIAAGGDQLNGSGYCLTQAQSDSKAVLTAANADPSQNSAGDWIVVGVLGLVAIFAVRQLI